MKRLLHHGALSAELCADAHAFEQINGIADPSKIYPGQVIKLSGSAPAAKPSAPAAQYYTVVSGDNLTKIAKKYGTTVNQLVAWNGIKDPNKIYPGQKFRVK